MHFRLDLNVCTKTSISSEWCIHLQCQCTQYQHKRTSLITIILLHIRSCVDWVHIIIQKGVTCSEASAGKHLSPRPDPGQTLQVRTRATHRSWAPPIHQETCVTKFGTHFKQDNYSQKYWMGVFAMVIMHILIGGSLWEILGTLDILHTSVNLGYCDMDYCMSCLHWNTR